MSKDWEPDNPLLEEMEAEWREQEAIADKEADKASRNE